MTILALIIAIVVIGVIVWAAQQAPIPPSFKQIILWVGLIIVLLLVLQAFGLLSMLSTPVPSL